MTVGSAMARAAVRLISRRPTSFFGSGEEFEVELCDLVNEVAEDVAAYQDWQGLIAVHSINGDGGAEDFPLPADYNRMLTVSDVQDMNNWAWGYGHYSDINAFLYDRARGFSLSPGGWIIYQNRLHFAPAPSGTAAFPYISRNYAISANGQPRAEFTSDDDEFVLPERLLTLGLVWRWRENKRLDASGDQEAFVKALDEYAVKDAGSRVIRRGGSHRRPAWGRGGF